MNTHYSDCKTNILVIKLFNKLIKFYKYPVYNGLSIIYKYKLKIK